MVNVPPNATEQNFIGTLAGRPPVIQNVFAAFQGQAIQPIGDNLAKILDHINTPVTLIVTASDPDSGDAVTKVRFDLDGVIYEDTNPADGWSWPNLDIGALRAGNPNKLMVTAYDSSNLPSVPVVRYLNIIAYAQACFIGKRPEAFSFANTRYRFDWKKSYSVNRTLPGSIPLLGGKGISLGLDLNLLWEHSILTHQDIAETFSSPLNFKFFGKGHTLSNSGSLDVDDSFNLTDARAQWGYHPAPAPLLGATYYFPIAPGIVDLWLDVDLAAEYDVDLNVGLDRCLNFQQASYVPSATVTGSAAIRATALLGVLFIEAGAEPNLETWFIVPLVGDQAWGAGGQFWIDYWAEMGTEFCIRFFGKKRCFTVWKVSADGTLGPWPFGDAKPSAGLLAVAAADPEPVPRNLPEVYAAPKAAADPFGNILVTWIHNAAQEKGTSKPELHAAFWESGEVHNEVVLTQENAFDMDPAVSYDRDGNAMIVWTHNKLPQGATPEFDEVLANNEIAYVYYNRGQNSWSSPNLITNDSLPDGVPTVAFGPTNHGLAAWTHAEDNDPATRSDLEIYYSSWNGTGWSGPSKLTNNAAADYDVRVAMDSNGTGLAVWIQDADADMRTVDDIKSMYSVWENSNWSTPQNLFPTNREARNPRVAFDGNDNPYAVWIERQVGVDGSKVDYIMFSKGNLASKTWSPPEVVFSDAMLVDEPSLSVSTHGNEVIAMITWRGYDGMDGDIVVSFRNLTTNAPWTLPTQLTKDDLVDWMSTAVIDKHKNAVVLSVKTDLYNPATDNSQLGNFADGINLSAAGISSDLSVSDTIHVNVNNRLRLRANEMVTTYDRTPVPNGPAGTFVIVAKFDNTSDKTIFNPFVEVAELSGGNLLLNADGAPGGVGATMTPQGSLTTPFSPGATGTFQFRIGLQKREPFAFFVNMLGEIR